MTVYHDRWGKHEAQGGVYVSWSADGGETWAEPVWIDHGAYPCLIERAPGRLMASYYRSTTDLCCVGFPVPLPSDR